MERSPLDIVRQQREAKYEEERHFEEEFTRDRIGRCLVFFHHTSQKFIEHLKENDYPYGTLTNFNGQDFVEYELYSTTRNSDGETYYVGSPLSLLIDADGATCYKYATSPEGLYFLDDSAKFFTIPTTVEEYQEGIKEKIKGDISNNGDDLLIWSSYFLEQIARFEANDPLRNSRPWEHDAYRRKELQKAVTFLFPDGENMYERQRYLAAQQ